MELLDVALSGKEVTSVAELGGVWGVDCAYGLYALDAFRLSAVKMVDTNWTSMAREKVRRRAEVEVLEGDFGSPEMVEAVGRVDATILFDVLLHQVAPDWDRILQLYAPFTKAFVIFNQQWTGAPISVRLLDLGKEEYFRNVPHKPDHPTYVNLFDDLYSMHPTQRKIWRDVHHVWQWGITTADLVFTLDRLGFVLDYFRDYGQMVGLPNFSEQAFVFRNKGSVLRKDSR